ncbi:hypothetical protein [Brevundimonas sp.]|uniref:hypothetical protein n=1 Tax=Brevundimonas sp. TaxID=1871086 RepID=UPI00356545C2
MSYSLAALRKRLADPNVAQDFSKGFTAAYFGQAFGSLPKSEIDLLVFSLLMTTGAIGSGASIYEIARCLNVTPAKARNLLFQHQLRTMSEEDIERSALIAVTTARFGVDGRKLTFGIESPIVRSSVQARARAKGVFTDISLSGDIVSVQMNQLGAFLSAFLSEAMTAKLVARLKANGVVDADDLTQRLNRYGEKMLEAMAKEGGKEIVREHGQTLLDWIGTLFSGGDAPTPEIFGQL